jgi:hypothetical protein
MLVQIEQVLGPGQCWVLGSAGSWAVLGPGEQVNQPPTRSP